MLGRLLVEALSAQARSVRGAGKPPWEDKSSYRVSKRGYHSNCHIWHDAETVTAIQEEVWNSKRKRLNVMTLITECGHERCVRLSHLTPATASQIGLIETLREDRKEWRSNMGSIRLLARQMQWDAAELSLVLRIPRQELKTMLETGPEVDTPRKSALKQEAVGEVPAPKSPSAFPPLPTLPLQGPLGNPANLVAMPGDDAGTIALTWTPAANATVHRVSMQVEGGDEIRHLPTALSGSTGAVNLTGVDPGCYWLIVIAGQGSEERGVAQWSQWSNWATVTL